MPVYRFDGPKTSSEHDEYLHTEDANGVRRRVRRGQTIELTAEQVAILRKRLFLTLSSDPVPNALSAPYLVTNEYLESRLASFVPGGGGGAPAPAVSFCVRKRPEDYGAKRDGKEVYDAAMAGASAVLTSASGPFTAADVGKTINVEGAASVNGTLSTTIASYQSATQVTLSDTASQAVTNKHALWGTDDTAAISSAINGAYDACIADKTYYCEVQFTSGIYVAAAPTIKGGETRGNAQIPLPSREPNAGQKVTIVLKGMDDAGAWVHWEQLQGQKSGAVIRTMLVNQTPDADWKSPSVIGSPTVNGISTRNARFFESNSRVVIPGPTKLFDNATYTIIVRAKVANANAYRHLYTEYGDWNIELFFRLTPEGRLAAYHRTPTNSAQLESPAGIRYDDNQWHTFVMRRNSEGSFMLLVDGEVVASSAENPGTIPDTAVSAYGNWATVAGLDEPLLGSIGRIAVWETALTVPQIDDFINNDTIPGGGQPIWWHDPGTASPEPDKSPNNYDGTVEGTTVVAGEEMAAGDLFSNIRVVVEGLAVLAPLNPSIIAMDLRRCAQAYIKSFAALADGTDPQLNGSATNQNGIGLYMPMQDNKASTDILVYHSEGFYYGLGCSDHINVVKAGLNYVNTAVYINTAGIGAPVHGGSFLKLSIKGAVTCIEKKNDLNNQYPIFVGALNIEDGTGPDIKDLGNNLRGEIHFAANDGSNPTVEGAKNVMIVNEHINRGAPPETSIYYPELALSGEETGPLWRNAMIMFKGGTYQGLIIDDLSIGTPPGSGTNQPFIFFLPAGKTFNLGYSVKPMFFIWYM